MHARQVFPSSTFDQLRGVFHMDSDSRHHLDSRAAALLSGQVATVAVGPDDELLPPEAVALWLGLSRSTLAIWRHKSKGPAWVALGKRRIRYRRRAVLDWLDARARTKTR